MTVDANNHTPGPWESIRHEKWRDWEPQKQPSSVCHVGDYTIITSGPSYEFHGTDEADARLIAAAPDLLGALKTMINAVGNKPVTSVDEAERLAIAAIAKATSVSP